MGQWRADSAPFLKVLRAGRAAACRNKLLLLPWRSSVQPWPWELQSWCRPLRSSLSLPPPQVCASQGQWSSLHITEASAFHPVPSHRMRAGLGAVFLNHCYQGPSCVLAALCHQIEAWLHVKCLLVCVTGLLAFPVDKISFSAISELIS